MRLVSLVPRLLPAFFAAVVPLAARATAGGPDGYGYTWRDSAEPGGPVLAWEDISGTGREITIAADDVNVGFQPLTFAFPYRGLTYARVAACSNGWASLVDGGADSYENRIMPTAGPPAGTLAAFWDDFKMDDGGKMFFQDFGDRAVVSWVDVPYFSDVTKHATFQLVLHADGRIVAMILSSDGPMDSATIGIEAVDDTDGLTAWFNSAIPAPPLAVEFLPPAPIPATLDCTVATALDCGLDVTADLATGAAGQDAYRCTRDLLDGREHVYLASFTRPITARIRFEALSGDPRLLVLPGCDPNACAVEADGLIALSEYTGSFTLVVDAPAGSEGTYRLRMECLPLPTTLDCASAIASGCGFVVPGDLATGTDSQDDYGCTLGDYSGREHVYVMDFPVQLPSATFTLTATSGDPDLVVLYPCDANACFGAPSDAVTVPDPVGTYWIVVDSAPGNEGAYEVAITGGASPSRDVGGALRASSQAPSEITLTWTAAPSALPGEEYAVLRSDDDPAGPFEWITSTRTRAMTDPAATPTFPRHVWYYDVRLSDSCGNLSAD